MSISMSKVKADVNMKESWRVACKSFRGIVIKYIRTKYQSHLPIQILHASCLWFSFQNLFLSGLCGFQIEISLNAWDGK